MRIVHTADWHLGRIFQGLHLTEDQSFVLDQLISLIKDAQPDVVLLAGDIYDRSVPPPDAVRLYDHVLSEIVRGLEVPVIAIAGNHDSADRVDFGHALLDASGYTVRGRVSDALRPIPLMDEHGPVWFCPLPYAEPALVKDEIFKGHPPHALNHGLAMAAVIDVVTQHLPKDERAVAIAHGAVVGAYECESERPLWVSQAGYAVPELFERFCYTALGHFHKPQRVNVLGEHAGLVIDYPGSPLKYGFAEHDQTKSVNLVEIDARGDVWLERVPLSPRHDLRLIEGAFDELMRAPNPDWPLTDFVKVRLSDRAPVEGALMRLRQRFPNLLNLEQPSLFEPPPDARASAEQMHLDERGLFMAFFEEMTGAPLTDAELGAFDDVARAILLGEETKAA